MNNTFDGTAPGRRPMGLGLSGENLLVARNHFSDLPLGITLFGNDPDFGTYLGIAHNAQLTTNRFCNVTTNVMVEQLATVIQQGTLTCPFPAPTLDIAQAVFLTWPNYAAGWTLESAPDLGGPWTPVDAVPVVQDGRYTFAVRTDSQQRFFRLRAP